MIGSVLPVKDPRTMEEVAALFERHSYTKGQLLLSQGAMWKSAYLIECGIVRMHLINPDGKEYNKNFHAEGALICPITSEMEQLPSLFAISALERSVIWSTPVEALRRCLAEYEMWEPLRTGFLTGLVSQKLQREYDLLMFDGKTRYQKMCQSQPQLAARVPIAHLASYLGLTDVSLSRIRRRLKEENDHLLR